MRGRRYICTPFHPSENINNNNNNHHHSEEPTLCSGETAATRRDPRLFESIVIIRFSHHHTPSDRVTLSQRSPTYSRPYPIPARFPFRHARVRCLVSADPPAVVVSGISSPACGTVNGSGSCASCEFAGGKKGNGRDDDRRPTKTVLETWGPSSVAQKPVGSSPL